MSGFLDLCLQSWPGAMERVLLHGTVVIVLAWAVCRLMRRASPAARCWVWRAAFLKLLFTLAPVNGVAVHVLPRPIFPPAAIVLSPAARASAFNVNPVDPLAWLLAAWTAGILFLFLRVALQSAAVLRLRRSCVPVLDAALQTELYSMARRLGLRAPELLSSLDLECPALVGIYRPALVLPVAVLATFSSTEITAILAHELAHLKRRDILWGWLPVVVTRLFFFFPLAWLAQRECLAEQELAADDLALTATSNRVGVYGQMLLAAATGARMHSWPAIASMGGSGSYRLLKRRLNRLREKGSIHSVSPWMWPAMIGFSLAVLLPWRLANVVQSGPLPPPGTVRIRAELLQQTSRKVCWRWTVIGDRRWNSIEGSFKLFRLASPSHLWIPVAIGSNGYELTMETSLRPTGRGGVLWRKFSLTAMNGTESVAFYGEVPHSRPGSIQDRVQALVTGEHVVKLPAAIVLAAVDGQTTTLQIE